MDEVIERRKRRTQKMLDTLEMYGFSQNVNKDNVIFFCKTINKNAFIAVLHYKPHTNNECFDLYLLDYEPQDKKDFWIKDNSKVFGLLSFNLENHSFFFDELMEDCNREDSEGFSFLYFNEKYKQLRETFSEVTEKTFNVRSYPDTYLGEDQARRLKEELKQIDNLNGFWIVAYDSVVLRKAGISSYDGYRTNQVLQLYKELSKERKEHIKELQARVSQLEKDVQEKDKELKKQEQTHTGV